MDAGIEKECSALGGLFQLIMNDMKASYPTWEDFVTKGVKLQSQLRATIVVTGAFLDAFQKVADMATGTRGATKDIGSALTRMCMRHRSIESKLKLFTTALSESLITPLELKMEEWKKVASQLDKDHAKEYKKARADIKKKSSDTIKLQKKVRKASDREPPTGEGDLNGRGKGDTKIDKGKDEARGQLDSALQDVNVRYAVLEETEKRAVCRALIEERARYCSFVSMLKPVLDYEINMLGEVTHLQTILDDLINLTAEPNKLPPASEQVMLDLKVSDFNYIYQTPPASPSSALSRKSSISSNYKSGSVRHVPSLDSITCAVDGVHVQDAFGSTNQLAVGGSGAAENGMMPPPQTAHVHHGERARAMSASGKSCPGRDQLALTLGVLNSNAPRNSRDSLHCSSGYSTQTTTPSCSEDTIHSHVKRDLPFYADYESISLHGDMDTISLHHLSHGNQSHFDKSSTIPRNSDLSFQYRKFAQSKRPSSTVSLLAEPELIGRSVHQLPSNTATIRRKPSSKPAYRRGTISGGVPIPICTPQVPLTVPGGNSGSDENVFIAPSPGGAGGLGYSKLCTSTQSLSALGPSSVHLNVGQMPIPVPVPTVPSQKQEETNTKQQHQTQYQPHLQISPQNNQLQQNSQVQQLQQQFQNPPQQINQQFSQQHLSQQEQYQQQQQEQYQHHMQQRFQHQQMLLQEPQQPLAQQQKQKLFQQQQWAPLLASTSLGEPPSVDLNAHYQLQAPPPSTHDQNLERQTQVEGGDLLSQIKRVKLKRTITNDRSAPLLPAPTNHKYG